MKRLYAFLLARARWVMALGLVAMALGWRMMGSLPVDVFPDIREPRVVIQSEAGGLTAEEVEQRVTIPIETAMNGLPGVRKVRASSGAGLSFVWVDFAWGMPLQEARFRVFERLAQVREQLPQEVEAEIAPEVSVTGEIMLVALTAAEGHARTLGEIRELAEFDLRLRLMRIAGVGEVVVTGGRLPELQVLVEPEKLAQLGLTVGDVAEAAAASRTLAGAGYLPNVGGEEVPLRQEARAQSVEALARCVVPAAAEEPLRLGDVAEVRLGGAPRRGSAAFAGRDAVVLAVQKRPDSNTLALTQALDRELDAFAAANPAVEVHRQAYRQADFINLAIGEGRTIVRDAALIVVAVLGLTLMRLRPLLLTLLSMPLSVLVGVLFFPAFGLGINVMTLGGLAVAIGDVVDCTIIFVEVIWRRLEENAALPPDEREPKVKAISAAAREVFPSVLVSTAMIVLVFLPLLLLSGLESRFFAPLGLAYLLIFGASFVLAVTVVPAGCLLLWREGSRRREEARRPALAVRLLLAIYRPFLRGCLRWPRLVTLLMALLFAGALVVASGFGASFLQTFREDAFTVLISAPAGTSLDESERLADHAVEAIRDLPGVLSILRRTGRAERDQHAEPVSTSELVVRVDLRQETSALRQAIRDRLGEMPGVAVSVGHPIAHRISAVLSGSSAELSLAIFGEDPEVLRATAAKVKTAMEALPEVADVNAGREILVESLRIRYDLEALGEMGLTLQAAGEQVAAAFNGLEVGEVREGPRRRSVVVRLAEAVAAPTLETVRAFQLVAPSGMRRRLDAVAEVYLERTSNLLIREQTRRTALITCNAAEGVDSGHLVAALQRTVEPLIVASGCSVAYSGAYEARQTAGRRLALLGGGLLLALFFLLTGVLREAKLAVLALLNVPLCLVGGVVAVRLTTPVLSVASLIGFVTVVGFVLRNGLLLLSRYRELEARGLALTEALMVGSCERLVPVLMTSLTTVLGLVPLVAAANRPGGELLAPLAIVQFGGLISATVLSLLVLPTAYLLCRRGVFRRAAPAMAALLFAGCHTYARQPLDWEAEAAAWQSAAAPEALGQMTLSQAQALALRLNPAINQARRQALVSARAAEEVGWWEDPTLSADLLRLVRGGANPYTLASSLGFTLPLSGVNGAMSEAAEAYAQVERQRLLAAEWALRQEVARAAIAWRAAVERHARLVATESPERQAAEAALERLSAAGEVAPEALRQMRLARRERQVERRRAEAEVLAARQAFAACLGLSPLAEAALAPPCDLSLSDLPAPPAVPESLALVRHPEVQAALAQWEATEADLRTEIRRQYPDLELGPAFDREEGENKLGLSFGLSLPLWNRNRAAIATAEGNREVARQACIAAWQEVVRQAASAAERLALLQASAPAEATARDADFAALYAAGERTELEYLERADDTLAQELAEIERRAEILELTLTLAQLRALSL
ncbi:MAG: CusA/CzcA family heavy metal efflux RND transporter [Candidatus Spyradenecus sp.]